MGIKRTLLRGFAAGVATVALIAGGASAASALDYKPPAVDGQSLTVVSSNELAAGTYRVGICTTATFGLFKAPACGAMVDVAHPGGKPLTATTPAVYKQGNANAHVKLPGHQGTFDCPTAGSCDVVIVKHVGLRTVPVENAPLIFK